MIAAFLFFANIAFAQVVQKPIIDFDELQDESFRRTVFVKMYRNDSDKDPVRSAGIMLKDGMFLVNEHTVRPMKSNPLAKFQFINYGKTMWFFPDAAIVACDDVNDICLLKTSQKEIKFFEVKPPTYRKITDASPVGLFDKEKVYFNGFCSAEPDTKKAIYVGYKKYAYETTDVAKKRNNDALELSSESGGAATCAGDSGGPLFDNSLTLYGMIRDYVKSEKIRSYALPVSQIRTFIEKSLVSDKRQAIPIKPK